MLKDFALDGARIAYHQFQGEKTPVLMLHSTGMDSRQWLAHARRFSKLGHTTLLLDFWNYGKSDDHPGRGAFDIQSDIDAALALIDAQDEPLRIVGHSYGAAIAMACARSRPQKIERLAVFEPVLWESVRGDPDIEKKFELFEELGFFDKSLRGSEAWLQRFVDFWNGDKAWENMSATLRENMLKRGSKIFDEVVSLCTYPAESDSFANIQAKILFMYGQHSPKEAALMCTALAKDMPKAWLCRIPNCGHMGPISAANDVLQILQPFILNS